MWTVNRAAQGVVNQVRGASGVRAAGVTQHFNRIVKLAPSLSDPLVRNGVFGQNLDQLSKDFMKEGFTSADIEAAFAKVDTNLATTPYAAEWRALRDHYKDLVSQVQNNQAELVRLGVLSTAQALAQLTGLKDAYRTTQYLRFLLGKDEWLKRLDTPFMIDVATRLISGKHVAQGISPEALALNLSNALHADDDLIEDRLRAVLSPSGKKSLLHKDDLPEPIRDLLGEIKDGPFNMAHTLATQEALISRFKAMENLTRDPTLWRPGSTGLIMGDPRTVQLPEDPSMYGPAAGGMVTPDLAVALHALSAHDKLGNQHAWRTFFKGVQRLEKFGVTTAGQGTAQWAMGMQSMLSHNLAGTSTPFTMLGGGAGRYFRNTDLLRRSVKGDALTAAEQDLVRMAKEMDVYGAGFEDIAGGGGQNRHIRQLLDAIPLTHPDGFFAALTRVPKAIGKGGSRMMDTLAQVQDFYLDRSHRFSAFLELYERELKKALGGQFDATKVAGLADAVKYQAAYEAARKVKRYFVDFRNPGSLAESVGSIPFIFNPFFRTIADSSRITVMAGMDAITETAKGNLEPIKNLSLLAGKIAAVYFGARALASAHGIDTDEVLRNRPEMRQRYGPFAVVIPDPSSIFTNNDQHLVIDLTPMVDVFRWFEGQPNTPAGIRFLTNMVMVIFNGGMSEGAVGPAVQATTGLPAARHEFPRPLPGVSIYGDIIRSMGGSGNYLTGMANDAMKTEQGQKFVESELGQAMWNTEIGKDVLGIKPRSPTQEPLSPGAFLLKRVYPRAYPVGKASRNSVNTSETMKLLELKKRPRTIEGRSNMSPKDRDDAWEQWEKDLDSTADEYDDWELTSQ
jgi:hypothetical protein